MRFVYIYPKGFHQHPSSPLLPTIPSLVPRRYREESNEATTIPYEHSRLIDAQLLPFPFFFSISCSSFSFLLPRRSAEGRRLLNSTPADQEGLMLRATLSDDYLCCKAPKTYRVEWAFKIFN